VSPRTEAIQRDITLRADIADEAIATIAHIASHIRMCVMCNESEPWYCLRTWRLNSELDSVVKVIRRLSNLIDALS
jgi:hypothetical protein